MPLFLVACAVVVLLFLIMALRLNTFLALVIVSVGLGLAEGMPLKATLSSVQNGMGSMLGSLVMILGFGAMLGKLLVDSGAVQRITYGLIDKFGVKHIQWAVMLTGFLVGLPMYYMAGFVLLVPLIFSIAISTRLPVLYVGIPMVASLSVTHGYLPPHPGPTAMAVMFKADMAKTLWYGIIISLPAILVGGLFFSQFLKKINPAPPPGFVAPKLFGEKEMPGFGLSLFTMLIPVLLMSAGGLAAVFLPRSSHLLQILSFCSEPNMSLLVSALTAGGVVLPLIDTATVSPELMVLAIGVGSLICSHVNDPGFWLFKEYFNLTIPQTLSTWTVMETLVSGVGLIGYWD